MAGSITQGVQAGLQLRQQREEKEKKQSKLQKNIETFRSFAEGRLEGIDLGEEDNNKLRELTSLAEGLVANDELDPVAGYNLIDKAIKNLREEEMLPFEKRAKIAQATKAEQDVAKGAFEAEQRALPFAETREAEALRGKEAIKLESEELEARKNLEKTVKTFQVQFDRAQNIREDLAKKYPEFNDPTIEGRVRRASVGAINAIAQNEPELGAYMKRLRRQAVQIARDVEGGRVTDQDMENILLTLQNPLGESGLGDLYKAKFDLEDYIAQGLDLPFAQDFLNRVNQKIKTAEQEKQVESQSPKTTPNLSKEQINSFKKRGAVGYDQVKGVFVDKDGKEVK